MEDRAECKKELIGFQAGVRESAQSWRELLIDMKHRGLSVAPPLPSPTGCACRSLKPAPPKIAVGDGALGFWKALDEVFPGTPHQRCWLHKVMNILDKVPKSVQGKMKVDLREISAAPTRAAAEKAIAVFVEKYGAKYPKAAECFTKDRDALLAFFPSTSSGQALAGRALGSLADYEPDRIGVRHGSTSDAPHQGRPVADHRQADGVQAGHVGRQDLAKAEGREVVAQSRRRCQVQGRDRGHRRPCRPRRLIGPVTQIPA